MRLTRFWLLTFDPGIPHAIIMGHSKIPTKVIIIHYSIVIRPGRDRQAEAKSKTANSNRLTAEADGLYRTRRRAPRNYWLLTLWPCECQLSECVWRLWRTDVSPVSVRRACTAKYDEGMRPFFLGYVIVLYIPRKCLILKIN